jgi:hypothetical protein
MINRRCNRGELGSAVRPGRRKNGVVILADESKSFAYIHGGRGYRLAGRSENYQA